MKRNEPDLKYSKISISQKDMFRIFASLTVVFIGDNSIRNLFRDFVKIFSNGHFLTRTEAALQHGEYRVVEGETRLEQGGQRGSSEYTDIRQYFCSTSSTRLIYIHIPTVFGCSTRKHINYLKTITEGNFIDVIIFSVYHGDLNFAKLEKIQQPFKEYLKNFDEHLNELCIQLVDICSLKKNGCQLKISMDPFPPNMNLTAYEKKQFSKIYNHTKKIMKENGFRTFNRNFFWQNAHHELLLKNSHYFSPKGLRVMTQLFAEFIANKWHRKINTKI